MIKIIKKVAALVLILFTISSCKSSNKDTVTSICQSNSELCTDLYSIVDCRFQRSHLIRARYYDKISPSEEHSINLLNELTNYESCLDTRLMMELTKHKNEKPQTNERKTNRLANYFTAQKLIKEKLEEIKNNDNPHIAYYLWTHHQDLAAKKVFLRAATQENTKDVDLLIKLASLYSKNYPQYSLNIFYKALRLSPSLEDIPQSTFISILTIYYQHKNFEQAYIWAWLAQKVTTNEILPINFDLILQKGLKNHKKIINNENILQQKAISYYKQLTEGSFKLKAPKLSK